MGSEPLLVRCEPAELIFPIELNKQLSSSIRLWNKTGNHVCYKLLSTNPKKYGVRPRIGVLLPGSFCDITVTTRAMKEAPHNLKCKDRFKIQSAVASPDATTDDTRNMFNKEAGHVFQEDELRVVYSKPESSSGSSGIDYSLRVPEVAGPDMRPDDTVAEMGPTKRLNVKPPELKVPLNQEKEVSCSLQLSNVTGNHVAFRVKTMSPKYVVQPEIGSLSPQSTRDITVKMQVQIPSDMQSEDKFLIQSMVATASTMEDIQDMFDKASSPIEESELPVVFIRVQEKNTAQADEIILRGLIICLVGLGCCYVMRQTLSLIWSLTMVMLMLVIKMVKKLVTDSVEDWVVKTLFYIIMYVCGRKHVLS